MIIEVLLRVPEVDGRVPLLTASAGRVDDGDVEELRWFFAGVDSFPLTFSEMHGVVDQEAEVRGLAASLALRWPEAQAVVAEPRLQVEGPHRVPLRTAPPEAVLVVDGADHATFPLGPPE
ncbi:MAG: hypothetical protein Q8R60_12910 [Mycobacteriales bacterium]|nr:hypothetical protein [Mycobacteriales bacterium]